MSAMLAENQSLSMQSMVPNWVYAVYVVWSRSLVSLQWAHTEWVPAGMVNCFD